MAGQLKMGEPELRRRLLDFDREVSLLYPGQHFHLVLAGGGALLLMGYLSRSTEDMDALKSSPELAALMHKYDINNRVAGVYADHFPYNWEDRIVPLDIETMAIKCFTASLEDVVASKLCSDRINDEFDVRRPEVVAAVDWDLLEQAAAEMELSQLNPRRYREFTISYEAYRKEYAPCDS